jgi:hypothetical protein
MQDAEMVYAKKIPKDEPFDARKLKKDFTKNLKSLKPSDHVLVVGCSSRPWDADAKIIGGTYDRCIYTPKPGYSSRSVLWIHSIQKYGGKITGSLNISLLSRLSEGCTSGDILYVSEKVLTPKRLKMMRVKPLNDVEFLKALSALPPLNPDEENGFKDSVQKLLGPKVVPEAQ